MTLHSTSESRPDYLYIRMWGKFDPFVFNQVIIEAAFRALPEKTNGLLIDIFHVSGFDSKALEALQHAENLCCMLPEKLKYAFLTRSHQLKEREFIQAVFGHRGLEVKLTSHLREATCWLRGVETFIPIDHTESEGISQMMAKQ